MDFDTYDISVQQLLSMLQSGNIDIAPAYQRRFRWDDERCSELIESLLLGIPVPSLFMATNKDATWELVDGVQRISTIVKFAGTEDVRLKLHSDKSDLRTPLRLSELEKLKTFSGRTFAELPETIQLQFKLRPVKVVTLSDKSDKVVRFDLFERLNSGGVALSDQEVRSCVYRGRFNDMIEELAKDQNFRKLVRLTKLQEQDATREECVLRFFAFSDNYKNFVHSVKNFLNEFMVAATDSYDLKKAEKLFRETFLQLTTVLPRGIKRPGNRKLTPLNLFEGVTAGAALVVKSGQPLHKNGSVWLGNKVLRKLTTGATNNPAAVSGRIEFCRDRFLGK